MNQVFAGGLALIISFILWSSRKQSKKSSLFNSQTDSYPKELDSSSSLVIKKSLQTQNSPKPHKKQSKIFSNQPLPNSIETKKKLTKLISGNPSDRLLAIQIASEWENNKALPFLRRGLKDSDSRVVIASAAGISSYKRRTNDLFEKTQASRPPRNVSLMR